MKSPWTAIARWKQDIQRQIRRRNFRRTVARRTPPYRLHLGCGRNRFEQWINVDWNPNPGVTDVVWNLTDAFPLPDQCCSHIYHEHFLEHVRPEQAVAFLRECFRLLKPGAWMRVATPDLEYLVGKYADSRDWRNQDWLTWPSHQSIQTRGEMLNVAMRAWGHQWLFDEEELARRLREAGFQVLRRAAWGESSVDEYNRRETRKDSRLIFEAQKPA